MTAPPCRTAWNTHSAGWMRDVPRPAGSPVSSVSAAAAMSLGVSRLPAGTAATICGSRQAADQHGVAVEQAAKLGAGGLRRSPARCSQDSSRPAKPAMVALRAAWAAASRAWVRMPAASWLVTKATINSTTTVTTSVDAVHPEGVNRRGEEEIVGERGAQTGGERPGPDPTTPRPRARPADRSCRPARCPSAARSTARRASRPRPSRSRRHKPGCVQRWMRRWAARAVDSCTDKCASAGRSSRGCRMAEFTELVMQIHMESLYPGAAHRGAWQPDQRRQPIWRRTTSPSSRPEGSAAQADARRDRRRLWRYRHLAALRDEGELPRPASAGGRPCCTSSASLSLIFWSLMLIVTIKYVVRRHARRQQGRRRHLRLTALIARNSWARSGRRALAA